MIKTYLLHHFKLFLMLPHTCIFLKVTVETNQSIKSLCFCVPYFPEMIVQTGMVLNNISNLHRATSLSVCIYVYQGPAMHLVAC